MYERRRLSPTRTFSYRENCPKFFADRCWTRTGGENLRIRRQVLRESRETCKVQRLPIFATIKKPAGAQIIWFRDFGPPRADVPSEHMRRKGRGGTWDARSWGNEYVLGEIAMLDLHIHKCAARHKEHR